MRLSEKIPAIPMAPAKKKLALRPILAAGGIVLRGGRKPLIAVVQLRARKTWVLPKGKLHRNETLLAAAKREAIEETGRDVAVYEYLGQIEYRSGGLPKVAKFWRMEAKGKQRKLLHEVRAVQWLPLAKAVSKLSRQRERKFLGQVGPRAVEAATRASESARFAYLYDCIRSFVGHLRRIWTNSSMR